MSFTLEPDDDYEPYFLEDDENEESDLLELNKWVFIYNIKGKYSCNIVIPNPSILGLEKTYEICQFLIKELKFITDNGYYGENNITLNKTLNSCIFLIEDLLHNRLNM